MPDFRVIEGDGPDKEEREKQEQEREQQRDREWAKDDVARTICVVAANMLRVVRGAGKPQELLIQMKALDAAIKFQELHGYWPDDIFSNELRWTSQDDKYWQGQREGRYTKEQVDRWLSDGRHEQLLAEHSIQCGALQIIASDLVGQGTQKIAGEREFGDGLHSWARNREERRQQALKAARPARAADAKKKPRSQRPSIKL